jgi:divalent metal cation (Fe/Co/Zn/Cd) transporter
MRNIANRHNLLSLRTDAKNSIKDGSASVVAFLSVLIATQLGFSQMDAVGGILLRDTSSQLHMCHLSNHH